MEESDVLSIRLSLEPRVDTDGEHRGHCREQMGRRPASPHEGDWIIVPPTNISQVLRFPSCFFTTPSCS